MDFEPDAQQQAIAEAVDALLARHAGPERALALQRAGAADDALAAALSGAGFTGVALAEGGGALEAALVVEAVARGAGVVAAGAQALVVPGVVGRALEGTVALVDARTAQAPVRFAAQARHALVLDGERAQLVALAPGAGTRVASPWGFPFGRFAAGALAGGEALGPGSGARLAAWWRVALAVEAVGAMDGALATTVAYVARRRQFGRAIGSFQAVQHRLAECKVQLEGARWLAREAAWRGAPAEAAAIAASYALTTAGRIFSDTHQLSGAMGFTDGHPLQVWTTRLPALRLELGGLAEQRREAARARWAADPQR